MEMPVRACGSNDAVAVGALVALEDEEERKLTVYVVVCGRRQSPRPGDRANRHPAVTARRSPDRESGQADSFELKRGGHLTSSRSSPWCERRQVVSVDPRRSYAGQMRRSHG